MARPQKVGLEYFPLDVDIDSDDKVAIIEAQHGMIGFAIVIKLFMKIYADGYFYKWREREQLLFSSRINVDINKVKEVVGDCVKWGLFDEKLYETHNVLTSKGIQRRKNVRRLSRYVRRNDGQNRRHYGRHARPYARDYQRRRH